MKFVDALIQAQGDGFNFVTSCSNNWAKNLPISRAIEGSSISFPDEKDWEYDKLGWITENGNSGNFIFLSKCEIR